MTFLHESRAVIIVLSGMEQPEKMLEFGVKVVTASELDDTMGMTVARKHTVCRRPDGYGRITGVVPGHGGDVYWVQHKDDETIGAYCFTEFDLATDERVLAEGDKP